MTDAEYAVQKARVAALAERWIGPLGLKWWQIDITHSRQGFERDDEQRAMNTYALMRCHVLWPYLRATIEVNTPEIVDLDDAKLEEAFVHELGHIFVRELRDLGEELTPGWMDHEERVVTQLGRAFLWLREHVDAEWRGRLEAAMGTPVGLEGG